MRAVLYSAVLLALLPSVGRSAQPSLSATTEASGLPRTPEQVATTIEKADLTFKVDPARKRIDGDARLSLHVDKALARIVLDLDNHYAIDAIEVDGRALARTQWRNPEGRLTIELPEPLAADARAMVRIRYGGQPHEASRAPWDGGFVWAKTPDGQPWVATAVQGEGCDLLWPCIDHPLAEPVQVDQHVTVPSPLVAAGNGVAKGMDEADGWRTWHWSARTPNTYAIALNIGPYELLQADYASRHGNTIPMRFWYLPSNRAKAEGLFAEFPPFLDFFEEVIGPYPFAAEKMGVVETPHLGMEHQTINAYGNGYKKDEYGYDWLLHHEFAHEWFGNQLTNTDWDDMWLHEGFGTYMQPLYLQWRRGEMEYMAALMKQRAQVRERFPVVSGRTMTEGAVYDAERGPGNDIYYKASLVLHTLRGLVGDAVFFAATRELLYGTDAPKPGAFATRHASTADFIAIVNRRAGRDLGWFFDAYLRSARLPELVAVRDGGMLALQWKTEGDKPFPMPVQVRVGQDVVELAMRDGRGQLRVPAGASVTLDPYSRVLRHLPHVLAAQRDAAERAKAAAKPAATR